MEFDVDIPKLPAFIRRMRGAPLVIREENEAAMNRIVLMGERESKKLAPSDQGHLRRSITHRVTVASGNVRGTWGTNIPYAKVVEEGRGAGKPMPPPGALLGWMGRHGIPRGRPPTENSPYYSIEFALARKIGRDGIKGKRFLQRAIDTIKPRINQEFRVARSKIIARLTGGAR